MVIRIFLPEEVLMAHMAQVKDTVAVDIFHVYQKRQVHVPAEVRQHGAVVETGEKQRAHVRVRKQM